NNIATESTATLGLRLNIFNKDTKKANVFLSQLQTPQKHLRVTKVTVLQQPLIRNIKISFNIAMNLVAQDDITPKIFSIVQNKTIFIG
uniref:Uncharacterized protein n=1 Tax=Glossina palpalis gambiensis TaxID=67801 RepID=A0A1B0BR66_9MUSC